ncbi:MAG: hypothetical protein Q4A70_03690 [Candidatus Saccharibacteria bacterium]|nr:hypothetical protein [Candidatus Saccharibacteria bacterium]
MLFAITSSCALNSCIDGWSDIDVLIVTKNFDVTNNEMIHKVGNSQKIRIALMLLTQYEFENNLLDDKTRVAVWHLKKGLTYPNYVQGNMIIPNITFKDIQNDDKVMMPTYLHKLRRLFWENTENSKRPIIKMLYIVIKMELRKRGYVVCSYANAFQRFAIMYNEQEFDILKEISSKSKNPSPEFLAYAQYVVKKICKGEYDI